MYESGRYGFDFNKHVIKKKKSLQTFKICINQFVLGVYLHIDDGWKISLFKYAFTRTIIIRVF